MRVVMDVLPWRAVERSERQRGCWRELCAGNPRLFDGPVLVVESIALDGCEARIAARVDAYSSVVLARKGEGPVCTLLSVTGLLVQGAIGAERVLMGRRGARVWTDPGLWEFGPSGGVEVPVWAYQGTGGGTVVGRIDEGALASSLEREVEEELGRRVELVSPRPIALVHEARSGSLDVVLRAGVGEGADAGASTWEYADQRWVAASEVGAFVEGGSLAEKGGAACIDASRALARWLGWSRGGGCD